MIPNQLDVDPPVLTQIWLTKFVAKLKSNYTQIAKAINYPPVTSVGGVPNFADDEVVAGVNFAWTLANIPNPLASLVLVQQVAGFGGIVLVVGTDYTIIGNAITTTNALAAGVLRAWYRY